VTPFAGLLAVLFPVSVLAGRAGGLDTTRAATHGAGDGVPGQPYPGLILALRHAGRVRTVAFERGLTP
jgi:hypothetical protein